MDSAVDLAKLGFKVGEKVLLADDDWPSSDRDAVIVDVEPVPGSSQCIIRAGDELRTVSRSQLRQVS